MPVLFGQQCVAPFCWRWRRRIPGWPWAVVQRSQGWIWWRRGWIWAIRNAEPPDSLDLAARRLGEHGMTLCASPAYLAERGNL